MEQQREQNTKEYLDRENSLKLFIDTAKRRINELKDSGIYPPWYVEERSKIIDSFTGEDFLDKEDRERVIKRAIDYAELAVEVFANFRKRCDEQCALKIKEISDATALVDNKLSNDDLPDDIREALKLLKQRLETARDDFIQYVVDLKKQIRIDPPMQERIDKLYEEFMNIGENALQNLGESGRILSSSSEGENDDGELRKFKVRESLITIILGDETIEHSFENVRSVVEKRIFDFTDLLATLENLRPEETANHFLSYYFPIIQKIRASKNYKELYGATSQINFEEIVARFYNTFKTKAFGLIPIDIQIGNGPFPLDSIQYKMLVSTLDTVKLLVKYE